MLKNIFSWTSAQLKCIEYNVSCSDLADFYVCQLNIPKVQVQGIIIKYINIYMYCLYT